MKTVIMCGGGGTRLWPLSRINLPKQFAKLLEPISHLSLFQHTLLRNSSFSDEFLVVVNKNQVHLAQQQVQELIDGNSLMSKDIKFLVEPFGKNTAAVIAMACFAFNDDDDILVVPSDHYLTGELAYIDAILKSKSHLQESKICLFGIKPTYPETGFGYIEFDENQVLSFKEKPNYETALQYLKDGRYLWNGGIFSFKVKTMKVELKTYLSQTFETASTISVDQDLNLIPDDLMNKFENISIDFAVIEKSKNLSILNASNWGWTDLGSFESLKQIQNQDVQTDSNTPTNEQLQEKKSAKRQIQQQTKSPEQDDRQPQSDSPALALSRPTYQILSNIHNLNSKNNFVISDKEVVLIDQNDLIVVDTGDALLISKFGSSSKVKDILPKLKNQDLTKNHLTVLRPWGSYTVLEDRSDYKVKSIILNPGQRLSLQKHKFRSEVWTVVHGRAEVTIDEKTFDMAINETCFIPKGSVHRLANKTESVVEMIEIQTGESFDESDIIRLQDDYGRI